MTHAGQELALVLIRTRELDVHPPSGQKVSHPEHYLLAVERLREVVVSSHVQRLSASNRSDVAGQHHHRQEAQPAADIPELLEDRKAVGRRHVQVEEDKIRLEFVEYLLGLGRVRQASNHRGLALEEPLEHHDVVLVVVHDQDTAAHGLASSAWRTRASSVGSVNGLSSKCFWVTSWAMT